MDEVVEADQAVGADQAAVADQAAEADLAVEADGEDYVAGAAVVDVVAKIVVMKPECELCGHLEVIQFRYCFFPYLRYRYHQVDSEA